MKQYKICIFFVCCYVIFIISFTLRVSANSQDYNFTEISDEIEKNDIFKKESENNLEFSKEKSNQGNDVEVVEKEDSDVKQNLDDEDLEIDIENKIENSNPNNVLKEDEVDSTAMIDSRELKSDAIDYYKHKVLKEDLPSENEILDMVSKNYKQTTPSKDEIIRVVDLIKNSYKKEVSDIAKGAQQIKEDKVESNKKLQRGNTRIKDISRFDCVRYNYLIGFGIVVGLNGTGDNLKNSVFTQKGFENFLSRLGINANGGNFKTKNLASVTVTAKLSAFSVPGDEIDVKVSTLGDATNIESGVLLATPLFAPDGEIYAISQGSVSAKSFENKKCRGRVFSKTSGVIDKGAIVEKGINFSLDTLNIVKIILNEPDLSTSVNVASKINLSVADGIAKSNDAKVIEVMIPHIFKNRTSDFLKVLEELYIKTDNSAKIVIDSNSGVVVIGKDVTIDPISISHGNLIIQVEKQDSFLGDYKFLQDLVNALNKMGTSTKDLIYILQSIKKSGALHGEIIIL